MSVEGESVPDDRGDVLRTPREELTTRLWAWAALLLVATGFVLIGGGNLDPGPSEARLGIAAGERLGPFGQVFGGWEPAVWPGQVAPSMLWGWGEGGVPTPASVRWPSAIAGVALGLILARRAMNTMGIRAALIFSVCWFGSVALIDRSAGAGIELIAGLATVAALDRILGKGSDVVAGLWLALAFLAAGWTPLALVALTTVVIGKRGAGLTFPLLAPPLAAALAWSYWALSVAPVEAWAAALTLPLTQKSAWLLAVEVVALGLPFSPLACLAVSRSVREGWAEPARSLVLGWLQVAGASLVAGTVVPGLASAAKLPALAGIAMTAAACSELVWSRTIGSSARRGFFAMALTIIAVWTVIAVFGGSVLASAVSYYRPLAVVVVIYTLPLATLAIMSIVKADPRRALLALMLVAVGLKVAHWGYYVPEWNYRRSQGPWGRAIGQWVPARQPIYTTHAWRHDLAFATERQFRQLVHPKVLAYQPGAQTKYVLLLDSEFEHWPSDAPAVIKVATFQDDRGDVRVLAKTIGETPRRLASQSRQE